MSYDVAFWRYEASIDRDHVAVNEALGNRQRVAGLAELDTDAMIACLAELLADWERVSESTWEKPARWHLQAWASPQHLTINMSYGAARPVLLKITTPLRRFGCGLWNPQLGRRLPGYGEGSAGDER